MTNHAQEAYEAANALFAPGHRLPRETLEQVFQAAAPFIAAQERERLRQRVDEAHSLLAPALGRFRCDDDRDDGIERELEAALDRLKRVLIGEDYIERGEALRDESDGAYHFTPPLPESLPTDSLAPEPVEEPESGGVEAAQNAGMLAVIAPRAYLAEKATALLAALDTAERLAAGGEEQRENVNRVISSAARDLRAALAHPAGDPVEEPTQVCQSCARGVGAILCAECQKADPVEEAGIDAGGSQIAHAAVSVDSSPAADDLEAIAADNMGSVSNTETRKPSEKGPHCGGSGQIEGQPTGSADVIIPCPGCSGCKPGERRP